KDLTMPLKIPIRKRRPDKASPACNQYSQIIKFLSVESGVWSLESGVQSRRAFFCGLQTPDSRLAGLFSRQLTIEIHHVREQAIFCIVLLNKMLSTRAHRAS